MSQCEPLVSNRSANRGRGEIEEMSDEIIGMLRIDSAPGKGTKVQVYIPLTDDAVDRIHHNKR